jgi:serine/threonine-protein kinase
VDPGEYAIVARAPGYISHAEKIRVDGEGKTVELRLPALVKAAAPSQPPDDQPDADPPPSAPAPAPVGPRADPGGDEGSGQRTLGIVVGGLGLAGVAIGSVFGLRAISKNSDAEEFCPGGTTCTRQEGIDLTDDAKGAAQISNIAFGVGAAGLIGGLVLYLTAPDGPSRSATRGRGFQMAPVIDPSSAGLGFWGVFR